MTARYTTTFAGTNTGQYVFNFACELASVFVRYTSSATAGNRQLQLNVYDKVSGTLLFSVDVGATQAASLSRSYNFIPAAVRETAFVATNSIIAPLGYFVIPSAGVLEIKDSAAINSGDSFTAAVTAGEAVR